VLEELESRSQFIKGLKQHKKKEAIDQSLMQTLESEDAETKHHYKTPTSSKAGQPKGVKGDHRQPLVEKSPKRIIQTSKNSLLDTAELSSLKNLEKEAKKVGFSDLGFL
jgi:hypothetical protein